MTPAALPPLTHHEILVLVEPFVRSGHRPDLAGSDRVQRRLAFHAQALAGDGPALPPLKQQLVLEQPEQSVADYERDHGGPLYRADPDRCCRDRKLAVVKRVLARFDAWMTAIRRDQSPDRATAPIVGWDHKFGVVKVSPLANWTKAKVWDTIVREKVPYNPLHDRGYVSIGCAPCTRAITTGEDERAGRWSGTAKTECGLHSKDA